MLWNYVVSLLVKRNSLVKTMCYALFYHFYYNKGVCDVLCYKMWFAILQYNNLNQQKILNKGPVILYKIDNGLN